MADDLTEARRQLVARAASAHELIERSIDAARAARAQPAFVATSFPTARAAAAAADRAIGAGRDPGAARRPGRLDQGLVRRRRRDHRRRLGDPARRPARRRRRPAVARLRRAGAALIGRTHMSEFAFSGVGINPHFPARSPIRRRSASTRRRASRAARPRAARPRSPPAPPGRRSAPTPAARSASRRRCRAGRLQEHGAAGADRRRRAAVDDARHRLAR